MTILTGVMCPADVLSSFIGRGGLFLVFFPANMGLAWEYKYNAHGHGESKQDRYRDQDGIDSLFSRTTTTPPTASLMYKRRFRVSVSKLGGKEVQQQITHICPSKRSLKWEVGGSSHYQTPVFVQSVDELNQQRLHPADACTATHRHSGDSNRR